MGHEFGFLVDDDSTNEGKRKALPMVDYIGSLFQGKEETLLYIGVGDMRIQYLPQRVGGSQSTSDNWRLKCTYSLS
jgi:hypothetical protein